MAARPNRPEQIQYGVRRPTNNYSMLANDFVERVMGDLTLSEIKVYLAIYRETIGWQRPESTISRELICSWAKIELRTFHDAIGSLIDRGLIAKQGNGGGKPVSYSIVFDGQPTVRPTAPSEIEGQCGPPHHDSAAHRTINPDPVLIDSSLKENTKKRDNPPTPLPEQNSPDMEQRIDHWAQAEASAHGVTLKINTGKKREALTTADSPELREQIAALIRAGSGDVTQDVLRLVGFGGRARARTGGFSAQPHFGVSLTPNKLPTMGQPKVDTALQETPLCREIVDCRNDAGVEARTGDWITMPPWKVAALDAMRLRDKAGFHERLTETFRTHADDYRQGVNTDAIVESFFESEQRHVRSERNSKTSDIQDIIKSLSAGESRSYA